MKCDKTIYFFGYAFLHNNICLDKIFVLTLCQESKDDICINEYFHYAQEKLQPNSSKYSIARAFS